MQALAEHLHDQDNAVGEQVGELQPETLKAGAQGSVFGTIQWLTVPFRDGGQSRRACRRQGKVFVWQSPQELRRRLPRASTTRRTGSSFTSCFRLCCFQVGAPQRETLVKAGAQGSVSGTF